MNRKPLRTRIAPTPSGFLHIGNLYAFVLTWLIAKVNGGTVRLRIDDLDAARMRTAYLEDIFSTLDYIGLVPDEGPSGVDDFLRHHSQQLRVQNYLRVIEQLQNAGLLYGCTCSRSSIMAINPAGIYPGTCRNLQKGFEGSEIAWRMALPADAHIRFRDCLNGTPQQVDLNAEMGDFVVRRKDGVPAYQVASLADDLLYGINLVVRGSDLLTSTAAQLSLAKSACFKEFENVEWHHHDLVKNEHNEKLSKSAGDYPLRMMMDGGLKKGDLIGRIAALLRMDAARCKTLEDLRLASLDEGRFVLNPH